MTAPAPPTTAGPLTVQVAAQQPADVVLAALASRRDGLGSDDAARRLTRVGPNAVAAHRVRLGTIAANQFRSPLLLLLFATAALSAGLGERANAIIIIAILLVSTGLGTANDYRSAQAAHALSSTDRRTVRVRRDGTWTAVDAVDLVPGDVVRLETGGVVPADVRLLEVDGLTCDESALTGEALPVTKGAEPVGSGSTPAELTSCAFMGAVVRSGRGIGVVVATGGRAQVGLIATGLQGKQPTTAFEKGLQQFSGLLAAIAVIVSSAVFVINLVLGRGVLDALLFAAAIAVGITPQLLPAVVSTSLAQGARELSRRKVLVKRLVAIEDLGDMDTLVTDKTGTLTTGRFRLAAGVDPAGGASTEPARLALVATSVDLDATGEPSGDALDVALWAALPDAAGDLRGTARLGSVPFDHDRRRASVLARRPDGSTLLVTKGAPESVLAICTGVTDQHRALVADQLTGGGRVIAVASRPAPEVRELSARDERELRFAGLLVFEDPPKPGVSAALQRLADLDIRVVIASGDSVGAAGRLARAVGLAGAGAPTPLSGADLDALDDQALGAALGESLVLARVSPEQKARVVRVLRDRGRAVGFLGDGVNDALALHEADVGLSVDTAADVAREAADVVLLEKSLDVVADGVTQGRRIFANTIKYVLMGTSSNFGNILSASAASAVLSFLPLLPSQLLLNNLLYDSSQLTIPTDRVEDDQLRRPGQWDIGVIRQFMLLFGPLSSLFDFATFGILLGPFHAGPELFRSGWFVESLVTQTLVVYAIRTRRVPFFRSRPSLPLVFSTLGVVAVGAYLPVSPAAHALGFVAPGAGLYAAIAVLAVVYLAIVDTVKRAVFRTVSRQRA